MVSKSQKANYSRREAARLRKYRREAGAAARDVKLAKCANPLRRKRALADVYGFLDLYFGHRFYNPLSSTHRDMIQEILFRATHGGDQAIAALRGEGKTTIAECVVIFCLLARLLRFPLIVAATGRDAELILANIKSEFETNELLRADFPEVCGPIVALEGAASRQNMQTVDGKRTRLKWSSDVVVFPTVPKKYRSPCGGSIIAARGLDGAIRVASENGHAPE